MTVSPLCLPTNFIVEEIPCGTGVLWIYSYNDLLNTRNTHTFEPERQGSKTFTAGDFVGSGNSTTSDTDIGEFIK